MNKLNSLNMALALWDKTNNNANLKSGNIVIDNLQTIWLERFFPTLLNFVYTGIIEIYGFWGKYYQDKFSAVKDEIVCIHTGTGR